MPKNRLLIILLGTFLIVAIVAFIISRKNRAQISEPTKEPGFLDTIFGIFGTIKKEQVYANFDGVKVYNNDLSVYKTAKKDEWVGTIQEGKSYVDEGYYHISGNRKVYADSVYIK